MKNLKRVVLVIMVVMFTMTSCNKEVDANNNNNNIKDCYCGVIANDGIDDGCYWLEIRNDCSGNKKKFCFDQDTWMNSYIGSNFCVQGVTEW